MKYFIFLSIIVLMGAAGTNSPSIEELGVPLHSYLNSFFSAVGGVAVVIFFLVFFFNRLIRGFDKKYDDIEDYIQKLKDNIDVLQKDINTLKINIAEHKSSVEDYTSFRKELRQTISDTNRIQGIVQGILRAIDQLERGRDK